MIRKVKGQSSCLDDSGSSLARGPAPGFCLLLFRAVSDTQLVFLTVFERYKSYSPYDIQESIRKEVKGDLEKSFITLGNKRSSALSSLVAVKALTHLPPASRQWSASRTDSSTSPTDSAKP